MNRDQHGHNDIRNIHAKFGALSEYFFVVDHGASTTRLTKDEETITKTTDVKKKSEFEALGLVSSSSAEIKPKEEIFVEKKQLQTISLKIKGLQYAAMKVSTTLVVKGRDDPEMQTEHDGFDKLIKLFNEFSVSVMVAIAEIEGSEGELLPPLSLSIYIYIHIYI